MNRHTCLIISVSLVGLVAAILLMCSLASHLLASLRAPFRADCMAVGNAFVHAVIKADKPMAVHLVNADLQARIEVDMAQRTPMQCSIDLSKNLVEQLLDEDGSTFLVGSQSEDGLDASYNAFYQCFRDRHVLVVDAVIRKEKGICSVVEWRICEGEFAECF